MRLLLSGFDHDSMIILAEMVAIVSRCDVRRGAHNVDSLFDAYPSLSHFHLLYPSLLHLPIYLDKSASKVTSQPL